MAKVTPREQKQADKSKAFEQQTGKNAFSPTLRSKRTDIMMWCDQGKNEEFSGLAHSTFAKLGKDLVGTDRLPDHTQVPSMATVDPPKLAQPSHASEGGPPAPRGPTIS